MASNRETDAEAPVQADVRIAQPLRIRITALLGLVILMGAFVLSLPRCTPSTHPS